MITYNTIIQYFSAISERHQQINSFTYGEISLLDDTKFTKYPALHLTPTTTNISDQTVEYGFEVIIFDRYNDQSNKMVNEAICLSDSLLILQDLCKELTDGRYFINEDTLINLSLPIQASPFIDTKPDVCSGWSTSFSVATPNEASACLIPYYNPEQQFSLEYIFPKGVPTRFAWYSREQIHAKANFQGTELNTLQPVYDATSVSNNTLTTRGNSATWNPLENGFKFKNINNTSEVNLVHSPITSKKGTWIIRINNFGRFAGTLRNAIMWLGDMALFKGIYVQIQQDGALELNDFSTGGQQILRSPFPIVPMVGTSSENQLIRKEPYTFAVTIDDGLVTLFYGMETYEKVSHQLSFEFLNDEFGVGEWNLTQSSQFNMQELIYSDITFTDAEVTDTMTWLNYR